MLSIIVCISKNNVIGKNNSLPWYLPADLKYFRKMTLNHSVIMGRKTFESIGKTLDKRVNIVLTRQKDFKVEGCIVVDSFEKAVKFCEKEQEVFIIGGTEVFKNAIPVADKIYMTRIHEEFEGDIRFPEIDYSEWKMENRRDFSADEKNKFDYSFITYIKKE